MTPTGRHPAPDGRPERGGHSAPGVAGAAHLDPDSPAKLGAHEASLRSRVGTAERDLGGGRRGIDLLSDQLALTVLVDQGCDLYSLVDRRTDIDVLFKPPWGLPPAGHGTWNASDEPQWLERYPGGWQVLCPNGGNAAPAPGGGLWGFHGEASRIPWRLEHLQDGPHPSLRASARLTGAPLRLRRTITVRGPVVELAEQIVNTSPDPIEFMWSHHPAFGAPLVGPAATLATGAGTFTADDGAPGTDLAAGSTHAWPTAHTTTGEPLDLTAFPGTSRALFGYLGEFEDGWFAISNPSLGLGAGIRWDTEVFPHAWLWQELHASPGHPWWREAYVCAIEPATTVPGQGYRTARDKGGTLVWLPGSGEIGATLEAVLFDPQGVVTGIGPGGQVRFHTG